MERSSDGFHIDLDDFLTGLLLLANELVSFTSQYIYILLTKREGCTGRISVQGLDSTARAQRGPYKKIKGQYSPSTVPSKLG